MLQNVSISNEFCFSFEISIHQRTLEKMYQAEL